MLDGLVNQLLCRANSEAVSRAGTSTFALKNRPRATRAIVKKVRTGCITCKRRHVKCDEQKPACQRCIKWGGQCEGYQKRPESAAANENQESEAQSSASEDTSPRIPTSPESEGQLPSWYPAMMAESRRLLYLRNHTVVPMEPGSSPASMTTPPMASTQGQQDVFWSTTVPMMLRTNGSVWAANVAIHALIESLRSNMTGAFTEEGRDAYSRALRHHGSALAELRNEAMGSGDLESATVCCLFFVVFEMLHGDEIAARTHIHNGCRMIDELQRSRGLRPVPPTVENAMLWELQKSIRFLGLQTQGANHGQELDMLGSVGPSLF
ncbi:unnamed protein product [Clonostachys rosea]|uniref:Zn(2)-C6 fungal-type domain-containing protein n=1 Tax=Bionectria ochroleuca TaxID=29856 RepID=A0ABY6UP26_BIOOC|nr:unnamed protein product [Clonostachys rosea]